MVKLTTAALALVLGVWNAPVTAQDPLTTIPDAYKVQFENEWVKVVRVHYAAGARLPEHTHPAGTTAYVYLNDSDGVVFRHTSGSSRAVTRPAVKAGSIRLAGGGEEHHTAENPAAAPSDFLRIQIKTMTSRNLRQRIGRPALRADQNSITVDYTSEPLVIQRFIVAGGQSITAEGRAMPSLWVAIPSGETRWTTDTRDETLANPGTTPMEFVRLIVRDAK
jgi:hypothetical protein